MKTEPGGGRRKLNRRKEVTEWMRCDAGGRADMAGALSRIKKKKKKGARCAGWADVAGFLICRLYFGGEG